MSSLYDNNYIRHYNNQKMYDILDGKVNYVQDPNDLGDKQRYVTLQHFLIKYMEKHGKTPIVNKLLRKYINDFAANPSLFVDSPLIRERIDKLMEKHQSIVKKYNEQYIKDRVSELSPEQLNTVIKTPDGIEETYRDYLYYDLLPRLDGHSEVEVQGKKVYVGNIIKFYNDRITKVNVNDSNYQM